MSELQDKIDRFVTMTAADPENEMAHFSLGQAYLQDGRAAEAATSFERCVTINPDMSKAYQLAGDAMIKAGWADKAVEMLNKGFEMAASKGDRMPQTAIAELLASIGRTVPELDSEAKKQAEQLAASGTFMCQLTGRAGTQLDDPPLRGPVGDWIQQNIAAETWREWIAQGTKVINELRLDFSREEDQAMYDVYMYEFLGIDDALKEELTKPAAPASTD